MPNIAQYDFDRPGELERYMADLQVERNAVQSAPKGIVSSDIQHGTGFALNPATGRYEQAYARLAPNANEQMDWTDFSFDPTGRQSLAGWAPGYYKDNSNDFLDRAANAASNIASNPAAQFFAATGGQGGMTLANAATGGDVEQGLKTDAGALAAGGAGAGATALGAGSALSGAAAGGAGGLVSSGGNLEQAAKGAAVGGAVGGALGLYNTPTPTAPPISESAAYENMLSGGTGAAGGMPIGAEALPSSIQALSPDARSALALPTQSGAQTFPVSEPTTAADLQVRDIGAGAAQEIGIPTSAPDLSPSGAFENLLSGGTGSAGAMPTGGTDLGSSVASTDISDLVGKASASSGSSAAPVPKEASGADISSVGGAPSSGTSAKSTSDLETPLSESAGIENALAGATGEAAGMPAGAPALPSSLASLPPEASAALGTGGGVPALPQPQERPLSESAAFENVLSGGTGAAGGMPTGAAPLESSVSQTPPAALLPPEIMGQTTPTPAPAAPPVKTPAPTGGVPAVTGIPFVDSIIKQMGDNALALGLIGATAAAVKGSSPSIPNEQQLQSLGAEPAALGKQLIEQYKAGELSVGQQAKLDQIMRGTRNQLNQYFASIGQSDSTAHAMALAHVDEQGLALRQQILDQTLQNGLAALGIATGPLNTIAQYQLGQDKSLRDAFSQFAGAVGNLFGRSSAAPRQQQPAGGTGGAPQMLSQQPDNQYPLNQPLG